MDRIIERSTTCTTRYMGHQVACILPAAATAGMVTDLLNNGQAIYEMGPIKAVHEEVLMTEVGQMLGLLTPVVASFATGARITRRIDGRPAKTGHPKESTPERRPPCFHSHWWCWCQSDPCASTGRCEPWAGKRWRGWHQDHPNHQMCVHSPQDQINQCRMRGQRILAVVGSACTTSAGATTSEDIARICQEHEIWFQEAHGASAAFSDTHRHLVAGMERADSVVLDFHKTCGIPVLCTGVFYADKNATSFLNTQSTSGTTPMRPRDTGKRTFECTNAC